MTNLAEVDFSNFKTANNTIAENSSGTTTDNLPSFHTNTSLTFDGCTSLTTVKGMDKLTNLTVINDWAFKNCPNLKDIDLSKLSALTSINQNVFEGTALTEVDLTSSVNLTSIGSNAFANASNLATVTMPNFTSNKVNLNQSCFNNTAITKIKFSEKSAGQTRATAEPGTFTFDGNSNAAIGLGSWVFDSCKNLTEATLAGNFYATNSNGTVEGTFQHATSLTKIDLRQMTGNPNIFNAANNFNDTGVIKTIVLDNTSTSTAQTVEIDGTNIAYTPATNLTLNANTSFSSQSTQSNSIFGTTARTTSASSNLNFGTERTKRVADSVNATKATSTTSIIADGADWTNASSSPSTTTGLGTIDADKTNSTLTITSSGTTTLTHNGLTWTLKTVTDGDNKTYQILEATEVATVRACNESSAEVVKYLDGKTPVNPSTAKRMTVRIYIDNGVSLTS